MNYSEAALGVHHLEDHETVSPKSSTSIPPVERDTWKPIGGSKGKEGISKKANNPSTQIPTISAKQPTAKAANTGLEESKSTPSFAKTDTGVQRRDSGLSEETQRGVSRIIPTIKNLTNVD